MSVVWIDAIPNSKWVEFYQVHSHSTPGKSYIVAKDRAGSWGCSCPAWTRHTPRKDCKHVIEVKATLQSKETIKVASMGYLEATAPAVAKTISRFSLIEVD